MIRIAFLLYSLVATTFAGSSIVVALTAGFDTLLPLLAAAAIGVVVAVPVTWAVARRIFERG
jgi:hypothetical protein